MNPSVDKILDEDTLTFTPKIGEFDTDAVAAAILRNGYPYHDTADPNVFALFSDPAARDDCRNSRAANPETTYPYVPLLTVRPSAIMLFNADAENELRDLAALFVTWLTSSYDCH